MVLGEEYENYIQFIAEAGELTLLDVVEYYEGLYECVFNNDFLEISAAAMLIVDPGKVAQFSMPDIRMYTSSEGNSLQ